MHVCNAKGFSVGERKRRGKNGLALKTQAIKLDSDTAIVAELEAPDLADKPIYELPATERAYELRQIPGYI